MATTGSADEVDHARAPAASVQPVQRTTHDAQATLDGPLDEALVAGFLLGYRDRTRAAYLADLRDFSIWCTNAGIGLLTVRRTDVEAYAR
jgi:hypothetical protein